MFSILVGAVACYTGLILWRLFVRLDSYKYPIRTYSDLADRIFGRWFKNMTTVLQTLQLIFNVGFATDLLIRSSPAFFSLQVGTICLSNAQSLEQITNNHRFCFSVAILIWPLIGMVIGQIRTLKQFGWLANSFVFIPFKNSGIY